MQPKVGGKFHLRLNTGERPIVNKYREGKMKRTLKRELKVLEIVEREALQTCKSSCSCSGLTGHGGGLERVPGASQLTIHVQLACTQL
jgi:hypothetical protein